MKINASLLRRQRLVTDSRLDLKARIEGPKGPLPLEQLVSVDGGRYTASLDKLSEPGTYSVTMITKLDGKPLEVRNQPASFGIFPVPVIGAFSIEGTLIAGSSLTMTTRIQFVDRLQSDTHVLVRMLDVSGTELDQVELRDDGAPPDRKAGDGVFAAYGQVPQTGSGVFLENIISGRSKDGLNYTSKYVLPVTPAIEKPATSPTSTETPEKDWPSSLWTTFQEKIAPNWWILFIWAIATTIFFVPAYVRRSNNAIVGKTSGRYQALAQRRRIFDRLQPLQSVPLLKGSISKLEDRLRNSLVIAIEDIKTDPHLRSPEVDNPKATHCFKGLLDGFKKDRDREQWWGLLQSLAFHPRFQLKRVALEALEDSIKDALRSSDTPGLGELLADATARGTVWELREFFKD